MRRKTHADFMAEVGATADANEYYFLEQYNGAKTPIKVKHKCGYEWTITPSNFLGGKRCPECAGVRKYTFAEARESFNEAGYDLVSTVYKNANTPMRFVCRKHSEHGLQTSTLSAVRCGGGCVFCKNENISRGQLKRTDIEYVRTIFHNAGLILLDNEYRGKNADYLCECAIHGALSRHRVRLSNIEHGKQGGCKLCANEKRSRTHRTSEENIKKLVEDAGLIFESVSYFHRDEGVTTVFYRCPKHQEFGIMTKSLDKFKHGQGCPHCNQSHGERKIADYLKSNQISFVPQKKFDDLHGVGGGNLSYDFFLPELNILIEYQGIQHRQRVDAFHKSESDFNVQLQHDNLKRTYASQNEFNLIEIWDYQFSEIDSLLSRYMSGVNHGV